MSSSGLISLLEYGYNRDNLDLSQLNFSMVVDKEKGIPVMYEVRTTILRSWIKDFSNR